MHLAAEESPGVWPSSSHSPVWSSLRGTATVHCHHWYCAVLEASVHSANSAIHLRLSGLLFCGVGREPRWIKFSLRLSSLGMQASFSPSGTLCLHEMKATSSFGQSTELGLMNVCVYVWTADKLHLADKIQRKLNQQLLNISSNKQLPHVFLSWSVLH